MSLQPVLDEDRHETTHTSALHETESTKHNADKAVSYNSTATDETSRSKEFQQQSQDSSDRNQQFNGEDYRIILETQSWRTAKNWTSSAAAEASGKSQLVSSSPSLISLRCSLYVFSSFPFFLAQDEIAVQKPVYDSLPFFHLRSIETSCLDLGQLLSCKHFLGSIMSHISSGPLSRAL